MRFGMRFGGRREVGEVDLMSGGIGGVVDCVEI